VPQHLGNLTRRRLLGAAALAAPALLLGRAARAAAPWTRQAYEEAMAKSGRHVELTDAQFQAIQARKPAAMKRIESYLKDRLGSADPAVLAAFEEVPREYYHYIYSDHRATPGDAYEENPKPWALGYGSALSDYLGQAYMTQVCQPKPGETTLEIGTGSGFQSSILSRIVAHAYSIEIIEPLGRAVGKIFAPLGYENIQTRVGDGYYGWPEVSDGFDIIIVTCAAQYAPPDLFKQLKPGGRMIIPIGQPFKRGQILYVYTKDAAGKIHSRRDVGVFFIPMTGAMMKNAPPAPVATQVSATAPAPAPHAPNPPVEAATPPAVPDAGPAAPSPATTPAAPVASPATSPVAPAPTTR
jgi:protein-L-isoaspartate(D-aspartate) O-methyltransferase